MITPTIAQMMTTQMFSKSKRIFQRFYQVDGARARKSGGLGLGLAMCDQIIRQHGGRISVESTPGEGSRFFVTFPARQEEET